MKRYICKKNEDKDCYREAVIEILDKIKNLNAESLIVKSVNLCENNLYRELLLKTLNNVKNNKRYTLLDPDSPQILAEDIRDINTIDFLLEGIGVYPIKIDNVADISLFEKVQKEVEKLLSVPRCKDNIIQGWQFFRLYEDFNNSISVFLCIFDDELGLSMDMEKKEYDKFIKENNIKEFYDVMLYGLSIIDYQKHHREFYLDVWN
ncbi:hypothetical protein FMM80_22990 [Schaedlerella arabinosiphila]|uniref:Uncharacterized protein n=1 Tax=Schaedlerella arabinosiphila TaxID=2044587 RepID=A0A9X5CBA4_9FIRM|nr:hypothetical protein [Schaedlerella arabinosiphila]KAI4442329.1 hypothetical protein C824_004840 [Schaedlerella arabinosiphila]NDO71357.1 hypothetical protein [Schaedlerella arabinosiphila]